MFAILLVVTVAVGSYIAYSTVSILRQQPWPVKLIDEEYYIAKPEGYNVVTENGAPVAVAGDYGVFLVYRGSMMALYVLLVLMLLMVLKLTKSEVPRGLEKYEEYLDF